jgi:hypothetical protein
MSLIFDDVEYCRTTFDNTTRRAYCFFVATRKGDSPMNYDAWKLRAPDDEWPWPDESEVEAAEEDERAEMEATEREQPQQEQP